MAPPPTSVEVPLSTSSFVVVQTPVSAHTSVAVVGRGLDFDVGEDEGVDRWLRLIEGEARTRRAVPAADADAAMDDDAEPPAGDQDVPMDS